MFKTIRINHNYFEYQNKLISAEEIESWFKYSYQDIYSAYDRPSWAKQNIWEAWFSFFSDFESARIAVYSRNSFSFTIIAETEHFFFYITAWHKKVWLKNGSGLVFNVDEDNIINPIKLLKE